MQISSRFTIAFHILTAICTFKDEYHVTSEFLAGSVQVNPVIIRNILLQLKTAGIVQIPRGRASKSITILKAPDKISLLDVYKAIEPLEHDTLFAFHKNPNPKCPVGKNVHNILDDRLLSVQKAMEDKLKNMKLSDVLNDLKKFI
ncbi:MAG: Rrf2 family transcriptional regulator [Alphaproteobacteria bacterium]|nr:Rrf2 family transcriptional regulator [Alphaproteobacteria bacterium]